MAKNIVVPTNEWADLLPLMPGITCTGRRVVGIPFDHKTTVRYLSAEKSESPEELVDALCWITQRHVHAGTVEEHKGFDVNNMLLYEQLDANYLARVASYGSKMPFTWTCRCKETTNPELELRECKRYLYECSNPDCACHEINAELRKVPEKGHDNIAWMNEHWVDVPEGHLSDYPPDLVYSGEKFGQDFQIFCEPLRISAQRALARYQAYQDEESLYQLLVHIVRRIYWPSRKIDLTKGKDKQESAYLRAEIKKWPSAVTVDVFNMVEGQNGGINQNMIVVCDKCKRQVRQLIPFAGTFYLPLKQAM